MSRFDDMANAIEELSELPTLQQFIASVDPVELREAVLGLHLASECKSIEKPDDAQLDTARQRLDACIADLGQVEAKPNDDGLVVLFEDDQSEDGFGGKIGFARRHCGMSLPYMQAENYSLEFVPWQDVLGWKVHAGDCSHGERVALAASAVWSITFCGHTERDVDAYLEELARDFKEGADSDGGLTVEEFFEMLDGWTAEVENAAPAKRCEE